MTTLKGFTRIATLVILGATSIAVAPAQQLSSEDLDSLVENAQTSADHLKLAAHFSARARDLAEDSRKHELMARRFQRRNLPSKIVGLNRPMVRHCKNLTRSLSNAARETQRLADDHRAMAEQVAQ